MLKQLLSGLKRLVLRLKAPGRVHYINGPETLPPPLTPEEEAQVFAGLEEGRPSCRACRSPCFTRRSSWAFSRSVNTGSWAVLMPQSSTLLWYMPKLPFRGVSAFGEYGPHHRAAKQRAGWQSLHRLRKFGIG